MSKLRIYTKHISTPEERERIIRFSSEYSKYIAGLPREVFTRFENVDIEKLMKNYIEYWDTDEDFLLAEHILTEAKNERLPKVIAAKTAISNLIKEYKFPEELFLADIPNHIENIVYKILPFYWKCDVALTIPKIRGNIELIEKELYKYGYVKVAEKPRYDKESGVVWYDIIFNPVQQESIRQMLNDDGAVLHHFSPDYNDEDIEDYGIIPKDGDRVFDYKRRAFYNVNTSKNDEPFLKMMRSITRQRKEKNPYWSEKYTEYIIFVEDLPEHIEFFWDPNAPGSVYTKQVIKYDWIDKIRHNIRF